ncbi:MAG: histidine ammonia-lyase [Calditrichaceae bacterium]|nr:histidine ammonia-lyase [Calditrichaceae bacterium]MBN2708032.1 histidine ammonia-lyase [Calditrichaceae bacterium]RQV93972.1 MAG: histidine ammonia-lyase [Calditrichota bacterium]
MASKNFNITDQLLTLNQIHDFIINFPLVKIEPVVKKKADKSFNIIKNIVESDTVVYGVNTGFGKFADVRIRKNQVKDLQRRLVLSHSAGVGDPMPDDVVRLMMLLKIKNLSLGFSGVRYEILELLAQMLNRGVIPVVPQKGSVGASGDLAPLAHMSAVMIGEGEAFFLDGDKRLRLPGKKALNKAGLKPIVLEAKEGLALLNGTQAMQAYGLKTLCRTMNLLRSADIISAMSLEALMGTLTPFDARIQEVRRHPGQMTVAANIRRILNESPMVASHRYSNHRVQDAYCLRCIPQVHGAVRDGVEHVKDVFEREMNGVTDNPLVFTDNGDVLSGGNFHGEPLAVAADYLAILLSELAGISERRIEHMLDPAVSEMAGFLTEDGGLNSGFMIAHVTAAALVSENKVLAHPASVDSIPTSANKEDHVSMGLFATRKALEILTNVEHVLAIELICACQALDLRMPIEPSLATKEVLHKVREKIAHWKEDRFMQTDIEKALHIICNKEVINAVEKVVGPVL